MGRKMTVAIAAGDLNSCTMGKLLWIRKNYRMTEGVLLHVHQSNGTKFLRPLQTSRAFEVT